MDFTHVPKHYAARTHEKMREVLMDPDGVGPAVHYYMIRGGKDQRNVTIWEPGTVSGEYIKTYGHYHVGDLDETYWILLGQGIAMLQKLALNSAGQMIEDTSNGTGFSDPDNPLSGLKELVYRTDLPNAAWALVTSMVPP